MSAGERIKLIQETVDHSKTFQLKCSARLMNGGGRMGIINSSGALVIAEYTEASLSLILTDEKKVSAYSSRSSENIEFLNKDLTFQEATENAIRQKSLPVVPLQLKGNEEFFDVILGPDAVAEWIETLASTGLNGLHYEEEESFVSGRLNQKLLGENICLYDDPMELHGLHAPFDFEGVPKKKIVLFEQGVAKSVCYDSSTADKFSKKSTGHALPPFERSYGAIPRHLFLKGGKSSVEEMIASSDEPTLYVTRFHYTNVVNSKVCLLTGMTKDGTFLIRKGKIVGPVSNLRFLESIPEALNRVTLIGEPRLVHDPVGYGGLYPEGSVVPPLKIRKVRFIGSSANLES
ncbi:MAG: hypothetical protein HYR80_03990 [Nitrospirae bacterium]|nr:hypothetical protein [Nitrospirota bacterium]